MRITPHPPLERLILAAAVLAIATPGQPAAAPRVHVIKVAQMRFGPAPRDVRRGDIVRWVNTDPVRHSATARDKSFNLDLPANESRQTMVRRAGTIAYVCVYHPGMTGRLTVTK